MLQGVWRGHSVGVAAGDAGLRTAVERGGVDEAEGR